MLTKKIDRGIATLTIDRAAQLNALNSELLQELKGALKNLKADGLILTGAGDKAFIAGADIGEMTSMNAGEALRFGELGQEVSLLLEEFPCPVIACVNGYALGGGCEMAISCDLVYSTTTALFGQPEVGLGLIPGFGGTQRLSRLVGLQWAKELIYTGRKIEAGEAHRIGLVHKLFDNREALLEGARQTLKATQKASPRALVAAKAALQQGQHQPIRQGLSLEAEHFAALFNSRDTKEGLQAFVEKRKPRFTGE